MNKQSNTMNSVSKGILLVVVGLLGLFLGSVFLLVFAPLVVYYLWRYHDRIKELESRLNASGTAAGGSSPTV